jgi:hypothetical protein
MQGPFLTTVPSEFLGVEIPTALETAQICARNVCNFGAMPPEHIICDGPRDYLLA